MLQMSVVETGQMSALATEDMSAVETGPMSAAETGEMSAVETRQMSAAETGQMSAAETRQMSTIATGRCLVLILYICLVSTCTSKDWKAHGRSLVTFSIQDCTNNEAVSWKLSVAFLDDSL